MELALSLKDVYKIPLGGAVMSQDTNRLFGQLHLELPPTAEEMNRELEQTMHHLQFHYQPNKQGDIIVSQKKWCAAQYLIEGIIYDVDKTEITNFSVVRYVLESCLLKISELQLSSVAMNLLGTEYGALTYDRFLEMFQQGFKKYQEELSDLKKIVFVPKEAKAISTLRGRIADVFGVKPDVY